MTKLTCKDARTLKVIPCNPKEITGAQYVVRTDQMQSIPSITPQKPLIGPVGWMMTPLLVWFLLKAIVDTWNATRYAPSWMDKEDAKKELRMQNEQPGILPWLQLPDEDKAKTPKTPRYNKIPVMVPTYPKSVSNVFSKLAELRLSPGNAWAPAHTSQHNDPTGIQPIEPEITVGEVLECSNVDANSVLRPEEKDTIDWMARRGEGQNATLLRKLRLVPNTKKYKAAKAEWDRIKFEIGREG